MIAAVAVSVGVPVAVGLVVATPVEVAFSSRVWHVVEIVALVAVAVLTHAARMFASVFTAVWGATLLALVGAALSAMPVEKLARFGAVMKAFFNPVAARVSGVVPVVYAGMEMCVASTANPASA